MVLSLLLDSLANDQSRIFLNQHLYLVLVDDLDDAGIRSLVVQFSGLLLQIFSELIERDNVQLDGRYISRLFEVHILDFLPSCLEHFCSPFSVMCL